MVNSVTCLLVAHYRVYGTAFMIVYIYTPPYATGQATKTYPLRVSLLGQYLSLWIIQNSLPGDHTSTLKGLPAFPAGLQGQARLQSLHHTLLELQDHLYMSPMYLGAQEGPMTWCQALLL